VSVQRVIEVRSEVGRWPSTACNSWLGGLLRPVATLTV